MTRAVILRLDLDVAQALLQLLEEAQSSSGIPARLNELRSGVFKELMAQHGYATLDALGHRLYRDMGMSHDYGWACQKVGCDWRDARGNLDMHVMDEAHADYVRQRTNR